jgi:hypothetical protein
LTFSDWISPESLLALVRNTAPFLYPLPECRAKRLIDLAPGPRGFFSILAAAEVHDWESLDEEASLEDYYALCLACHQATVATFVPTDVDTKIRGLTWRKTSNRETLRNMVKAGLAMRDWTIEGISTRAQYVGDLGPVSGHNGEWLSVMAGAHGRLLQRGDTEYAEITAVAIEQELERELQAFYQALGEKGREIDVLCLAMSITHNLGDLDQGISFWESSRLATGASRARFGRLAHENTAAFGGRFVPVSNLYKKAMASEGHRHYPLRAVKPLRKSADFLLPLGPFFDAWGGMLITHPELDHDERAEILDALVRGCRKVPNQQGYFRAIAGMLAASQRNFDLAAERMPNASKKELRDPGLRRQISIPRSSFESSLKKMVAGSRS